MPAELRAGDFDAAVIAEPFGSVAEESTGAVPMADLSVGATANFPIEGYAVTKRWARMYPRTLAAFYKALEEGQQIAGTNRTARGVPAATARLVRAGDGDHVAVGLSGQPRSGRQRGQDSPAARGQPHAAVHRASGLQHRFHADARLTAQVRALTSGGGLNRT